jgi:hypothetical protein
MVNEAFQPDIRVGQIVSVYDDRIEFEKREFVSGMKLCDDWVVELPAKAKSFEARAKSAMPAEFPSGAKLSAVLTSAKSRGLKRDDVSIEPEEKTAIRFEFPPADAGGRVAEYEISAVNAGGTEARVRICATGAFYPRKHGKFSKKVVATIFTDRFPVGAESFRVTPLDSYGKAGRAISCVCKV